MSYMFSAGLINRAWSNR